MKTIASVISAALLCCSLAAQDYTIPLYEGEEADSIEKTGDAIPEIEVFVPERPGPQAILVCPGGGYGGLSYPSEGLAVAKWMNSRGITTIVLKYRMPKGRCEVPLQDVRKAMTLVKDHISEWVKGPVSVGVMGFSAGGHLASTALVNLKGRVRPDFGILVYPVITMDAQVTHGGSRANLLGKHPSAETVERFSSELQVTPDTPPVLLFHCTDDPAVQPENSILFYEALKKNGVPAELHIFDKGGHSWGISNMGFAYYDEYHAVMERWLKERCPSNPEIRVACVGNSITFGAGLQNRDRDSYPAVLGQMLGKGWKVKNFGVSGTTLLSAGESPYIETAAYRSIFEFNPDIILIKLGTNDSKGQNWKYKADFERDYQALIDTLQTIGTHPRILLCLPAASYVNGSIKDSVIVHGVIPRIRTVAERNGLEIVDMHAVTSGRPEYFPDKLHPNREGSLALAKAAYEAITGKDREFSLQDFPGVKSKWNGYDKYDFEFNGRSANIVVPKTPLPGKPWIWRPAFFGAFPAVDIAMLSLGYYVVHYDLAFLYGSPRSQKLGDEFYAAMRKYYGFSEKVILEGFSRGGLFAVNWAAGNSDKVSCIYLDAPVCDISSWPGKKRPKLWREFLDEWDISEREAKNFKDNPLDHLKPLAEAGIPIMGVAGDSDRTVPYEENLGILAKKYRELGGDIEVIVKEGCDHHPHSLDAPAPIIRFILDKALK